MVTIKHRHRVTPGRLHLNTDQLGTRATAQNFMPFNFPTGQDGFKQAFGQYQRTGTVFFNANQHIIERITHANKAVGRQCPRRRRPDHNGRLIGLLCPHTLGQVRGIQYRKGHIDIQTVLVSVFDLGFSQSGLTVRAPIDRLFALTQVPTLNQFTQGTNGIGFGLGRHGQVWIIPIAQDT